MRILITIPHFFSAINSKATNRSNLAEARNERTRALVATIAALRQTFGTGVYGLDHFRAAAWQSAPSVRHSVDIVVCTTGDSHLLNTIPSLRPLYRHHKTIADPMMLGFECHEVLGAARGRYDFYGYLEDDIVVTDALFFRKRRLFDKLFGPAALLQPNRYEAQPDGPVQKLYVDYHTDRTSPPRIKMSRCNRACICRS